MTVSIRLVSLALAVAALMAAQEVIASDVRYRIVDLGTLGGTGSFGVGINDLGQAVGTSMLNDVIAPRPFLYSDGIADLGATDDQLGRAIAINNRGQVVGDATTVTPEGYDTFRAFLFENGALTNLGSLGGIASQAVAINNAGQIVGWSMFVPPPVGPWTWGGQTTIDQSLHAFLYEGGVMRDLHVLAGLQGANSSAVDVNDGGQIVGTVDSRGFLYHAGTTIELDASGADSTQPLAINNRGQIVGYLTNQNGDDRAFVYENGTWGDLGSLGGAESVASDINNSGTIVGQANLAELRKFPFIPIDTLLGGALNLEQSILTDEATLGDPITGFPIWHAFIYEYGSMIDLNTLIPAESEWELEDAAGINALGQIVGTGRFRDSSRAYLLIPISEPCTAMLFAVSAIALMGAPSRSRRAVGCILQHRSQTVSPIAPGPLSPN